MVYYAYFKHGAIMKINSTKLIFFFGMLNKTKKTRLRCRKRVIISLNKKTIIF